MAQWVYKIDISGLHKKYEEGEATIQEIAKEVCEMLKPIQNTILQKKEMMEYSTLNQLSDIIDTFETISFDADVTVDDYDIALANLYNWGDMALDRHMNGKKMCWVNTL